MNLSSNSKLLLVVSLIAIWKVEAYPWRDEVQSANSTALMNDKRIVGGEEVHEPIPYMISLMWMGEHHCGGSIINPRTIITCEHCIRKRNHIPYIKVHVGDITITKTEGEILDVESYVEADFADVALVRLVKDLVYSERVQPIPLIDRNAVLKVGSMTSVYGWGHTKFAGEKSPILKVAHIPIVDTARCQKLMKHIGPITPQMLCAGIETGGLDSCQADSGGPLVQDGRLIGLVSWGDGCALKNTVGVYTNVQASLDWIERTLRDRYNDHL